MKCSVIYTSCVHYVFFYIKRVRKLKNQFVIHPYKDNPFHYGIKIIKNLIFIYFLGAKKECLKMGQPQNGRWSLGSFRA